MSDPEVPQTEPTDVDGVVDSANAGLADAQAASEGIEGARAGTPAGADVDPDLAAFEAAEREHPGTFVAGEVVEQETRVIPRDEIARDADAHETVADRAYASPTADTPTIVAPTPHDDQPTHMVPSEPAIVPPVAPQPIFVQAPEPPRPLGNRGTIAGIGLLAALLFAVLYLGATLGLGAIKGTVTGENIGTAALAPLTTWGFWVPVVVFFLGFWFLGAIINRGRWGLWVVFGILVGIAAYGGHILGQLFEAPFWNLSASEGLDLVGAQLLAPLAIVAFVLGRELTIWFGAWAARSGARKTVLNAEAQSEYERTLEAGPSLSR